MHLNEMARELQITTQELRRELEKTNFGISPTAHEIDDAMSAGIIRFLKGKIKPTRTNRRVAIIMKDGQIAEEKVVTTEEVGGEMEMEREKAEVKEREKAAEEEKRPKRAMTKKEREMVIS